jgi:hypothetical protein
MRRFAAMLLMLACRGGAKSPPGAPPAPSELPAPIGFEHQPFTGKKPDAGRDISFLVEDRTLCDRRADPVDPKLGPAPALPCTTRSPALGKWEADAPALRDGDEAVAPASLRLVVDYPLARAIGFDLATKDPRGFTRRELFERIAAIYDYIYRQERETERASPAGASPSWSDGVFGIWGHGLGELGLRSVRLVDDDEGHTIAWLAIDS